MKSYKTTVFFIALFALLAWGGLLQAQYDDIYYDPDTDGEYYDYSSNTNSGDTYAYSDDNGAYDDDSYDHYEVDYDYYYSCPHYQTWIPPQLVEIFSGIIPNQNQPASVAAISLR